MASRVLRLGLIGTGKHGSRYARHIRDDLPDLELAAVARRDASRAAAAAREFGGEAHSDYGELIRRGDLDAVIAVVPPVLHLDILRQATAAGLPLLLEKPAAPNLRDGRAMLDILGAHPVPVMVAHTLRYNSVVRELRRRRAELGAVYSLAFTQRFEPSPLGWLDDPEQSGGGMTLHTGVHSFDLLRLLSGLEPLRVTCQMQCVRTRRTEDSFAATVRLGDGAALATVACARTAAGRNGHIEVAGEGATLIADHVLNRAWIVKGTEMQAIEVGDPTPTVREVIRDFTVCLRTGRPMPVPLEDGLRAVAVADACYAAARSGAEVAVEDATESPVTRAAG